MTLINLGKKQLTFKKIVAVRIAVQIATHHINMALTRLQSRAFLYAVVLFNIKGKLTKLCNCKAAIMQHLALQYAGLKMGPILILKRKVNK